MTERDMQGGPSTEGESTSISSRSGGFTDKGNFDLGFDMCVGVYQVAREEHPKAAFKYFTIYLQELCP